MLRARLFAWKLWRWGLTTLLALTLAVYVYSVLGTVALSHYGAEKHSLSLSRGCMNLGWMPSAGMSGVSGAPPGPASAWSFEWRFRPRPTAVSEIRWWFEFHRASSITRASGAVINTRTQPMSLVMPLWAPVLLVAGATLLTRRRHARLRAIHLKSGRCPRCRRSRAGLLDNDACPECGDVPGERELAMIAARL